MSATATIKIETADPVVERPPTGVPMIGQCYLCDWRGLQAFSLCFRADFQDTATVSKWVTVCHGCEGLALEILEDL